MNGLKQMLLSTSLALLAACGPSITFDEAQPSNTKALSKFPDKARGDYISDDQASVVTISDDFVLRTYDYTVKTLKDSIPFAFHLRKDTLFSNEGEDSVFATNVKVNGDTMLTEVHYTDTLFMLTDSSVLKKFRGYYFLNERFKTENGYTWGVRKLSVVKGILTITEISSPKDLANLREITDTSGTTVSNFAPTRKQFREFLKAEDEEGEKFTLLRHR